MIKVEKIIPGGQALGTHEDGRKIFFWNALPGEIITEYNITKKKSHYYEAVATRISHPSIYRVQPQDDCYLSTSPWQIVDYNYELQLKKELITEIFHEHHISSTTTDIVTNNQDYNYRNKMEYSLFWDKEQSQISLAFHQRGTHRKIPVAKSSIEHPEIFKAATKIIQELNQRNEPAYKYQSILLRCNQSGDISGGLYENHQPHPTFPRLTDTILDHTYSYSPNGFFQINIPVYEMALRSINSFIDTDEVLDLYAGVGTIGLSTASDRKLTLVECDKYAYNEMINNINNYNVQSINKVGTNSRNQFDYNNSPSYHHDNITGILAKSEEALSYIKPTQTIILDPPRSGCDSRLINKLNETKPSTIIYLSCNPTTQARDVKLLLNKYKITNITTFNFFPHTPHIENLVILHI